MKPYILKAVLIGAVLLIGLWVSNNLFHMHISALSYFSVLYVLIVFVLIHYFIHHDKKITENKRIRKLMIGSMARLFLLLIFLAISLFNMQVVLKDFVVVFAVTFFFYLFFDIMEMRTNLRPDLEQPNKNTNV